MCVGKRHPSLQLVPNGTVLTANDVEFVHCFRFKPVSSLDVSRCPSLDEEPDHPHQDHAVSLRGGNHRIHQYLSFLRRHQPSLDEPAQSSRCQYGTMRSCERRICQQVEQADVPAHELKDLSRRRGVSRFFVWIGRNHALGMGTHVHVNIVEATFRC